MNKLCTNREHKTQDKANMMRKKNIPEKSTHGKKIQQSPLSGIKKKLKRTYNIYEPALFSMPDIFVKYQPGTKNSRNVKTKILESHVDTSSMSTKQKINLPNLMNKKREKLSSPCSSKKKIKINHQPELFSQDEKQSSEKKDLKEEDSDQCMNRKDAEKEPSQNNKSKDNIDSCLNELIVARRIILPVFKSEADSKMSSEKLACLFRETENTENTQNEEAVSQFPSESISPTPGFNKLKEKNSEPLCDEADDLEPNITLEKYTEFKKIHGQFLNSFFYNTLSGDNSEGDNESEKASERKSVFGLFNEEYCKKAAVESQGEQKGNFTEKISEGKNKQIAEPTAECKSNATYMESGAKNEANIKSTIDEEKVSQGKSVCIVASNTDSKRNKIQIESSAKRKNDNICKKKRNHVPVSKTGFKRVEMHINSSARNKACVKTKKDKEKISCRKNIQISVPKAERKKKEKIVESSAKLEANGGCIKDKIYLKSSARNKARVKSYKNKETVSHRKSICITVCKAEGKRNKIYAESGAKQDTNRKISHGKSMQIAVTTAEGKRNKLYVESSAKDEFNDKSYKLEDKISPEKIKHRVKSKAECKTDKKYKESNAKIEEHAKRCKRKENSSKERTKHVAESKCRRDKMRIESRSKNKAGVKAHKDKRRIHKEKNKLVGNSKPKSKKKHIDSSARSQADVESCRLEVSEVETEELHECEAECNVERGFIESKNYTGVKSFRNEEGIAQDKARNIAELEASCFTDNDKLHGDEGAISEDKSKNLAESEAACSSENTFIESSAEREADVMPSNDEDKIYEEETEQVLQCGAECNLERMRIESKESYTGVKSFGNEDCIRNLQDIYQLDNLQITLSFSEGVRRIRSKNNSKEIKDFLESIKEKTDAASASMDAKGNKDSSKTKYNSSEDSIENSGVLETINPSIEHLHKYVLPRNEQYVLAKPYKILEKQKTYEPLEVRTLIVKVTNILSQIYITPPTEVNSHEVLPDESSSSSDSDEDMDSICQNPGCSAVSVDWHKKYNLKNLVISAKDIKNEAKYSHYLNNCKNDSNTEENNKTQEFRSDSNKNKETEEGIDSKTIATENEIINGCTADSHENSTLYELNESIHEHPDILELVDTPEISPHPLNPCMNISTTHEHPDIVELVETPEIIEEIAVSTFAATEEVMELFCDDRTVPEENNAENSVKANRTHERSATSKGDVTEHNRDDETIKIMKQNVEVQDSNIPSAIEIHSANSILLDVIREKNNSQELFLQDSQITGNHENIYDQKDIENDTAYFSNNDFFKTNQQPIFGNMMPAHILNPCLDEYIMKEISEVSNSDDGPVALPGNPSISQSNDKNMLTGPSYGRNSSGMSTAADNVNEAPFWGSQEQDIKNYIDIIMSNEASKGSEYSEYYFEKTENVFPSDDDNLYLNEEKVSEEAELQLIVSSESTGTDDGNAIHSIL